MLRGNNPDTVILDELAASEANAPVIDWARIQSRLKQLRFYLGQPGGVVGRATRLAITSFQISHGLKAHGRIDRETMVALFGADDPQADQVEV